MAAKDAQKQTRRAGSLGAVSLRLVVALGASTGLTAAVALPMAYQAQQAREQDQVARQRQTQPPGVEVLGSSTVPAEDGLPHEGLYWAGLDTVDEPEALHRSTLSGPVHIIVDLPGVERVDFRLNDGPVTTVTADPWRFPEADPFDTGMLGAGEHMMLATVEFEDGRNELREATFTVSAN